MTKRIIHVIRSLFIVGGFRIWILYGFVLFIVVAPAVAIRTANYARLQNDVNKLTTLRHEKESAAIASQLKERLHDVQDFTESLANQPQVREAILAGKWQAAIDLISVDQQLHPNSFVDRFFISDAKGVLQIDSPALPNVRGVDFSYRPWYTAVLATGKPFISPVYRRVGQPEINVVSVSAPVTNDANQIVAIIGTQISADHFSDWIRTLKLEKGENVNVIDQAGNVVADVEQPAQEEIHSRLHEPIVQQLLHGESGVVQTQEPELSQRELLSYSPVEKYGWGIIIAQPLQLAFSETTQTLSQFLQLEWSGAAWNIFILISMLMVIHRLIQYLFADEIHKRSEFPMPSRTSLAITSGGEAATRRTSKVVKKKK